MSKTEKVLKTISKSLESVRPEIWPDRGFTSPRGAISETYSRWIQDADARQLRECVVRFADVPSYGTSLCFYNLTLSIDVAYPCSIPEDLRESMITSDANEIMQQITRRPNRWGGADSVYPQGASVQSFSDENGTDTLFVLTVSFNVILSEFK